MKTTTARITAIAATSFLLLSAIGFFVPTATAQIASTIKPIHIPDPNLPNNRLLPETGEARPKLETKVEVNAAGTCAQSIVLTFKVNNKQPYMNVILNPSTATVAIRNTGNTQVPSSGGATESYPTDPKFVEMVVTTNREAPAFQDAPIDILITGVAGQVTSQQPCHVANPPPVTASMTIKNDYLPLVVLNPGSLYTKAGQNKKVIFPVEIQNLGNGPTRIKLEASQPNKNKLDAISTGAEVRLESRAGKGPSALFKTPRNIEVQTPHSNGYSNSIYQFNVKFTSQFDGTATGTLAQDEQVVQFAVQVQGVYVPGFEPLFLLGALAVGMAVIRRRAKD